jgi:hypothetical protein
MTALDRYARLEGSGLWRPDAGAQRRDVGVRLGKSSLVLADARSGTVLSHWTLSTISRDNPGRRPARYLPGTEAEGESLETDDEMLIEALETIRAAITPRLRGRQLRWTLAGLALAGTVATALWLPQFLVTRTAAIVPGAMRNLIGREALEDLTSPGSAVRVCGEPSGRQTLTALRNRVLGPDWRVLVIDGLAGFDTGHLPGRMIILSRGLLERLDSPEALAGWMLAEELVATERDPLLDVLRRVGTQATLSLLSFGTLPEGALTGYAGARLTRSAPGPDPATLVQRLSGLGIGAGPYAASLPAAARRQIEGQPGLEIQGPPLLTDGQWLTLQAVCQG